MKIFGKELFKKKSRIEQLIGHHNNDVQESKYLPDFIAGTNQFFSDEEMISPYLEVREIKDALNGKKKKGKKEETVIALTPKGVHELKLLNEEGFKINVDQEYVDAQIADFKNRLTLVKGSERDMRNGVIEVTSMVMRLENRKKYADFASFYEEFPYTKQSKVQAVINNNNHLKLGNIEQFVASLPKEAIDAMDRYREQTTKLCGKEPVFYIIADKKDFRRTNERKDPILLAQSPFAHVWQILGAWDEEMIFLEEL